MHMLPAVLLTSAKRVQHLNQIDFLKSLSYSLENNEEEKQPEFLSFVAVGSIIIFEMICLRIRTP